MNGITGALLYERKGLGNDAVSGVVSKAISQKVKKISLQGNKITDSGIRVISSALMPNIPLDMSPDKALKSASKQAKEVADFIRGEQVDSFVKSMATVEKALSTKSSLELTNIIKKENGSHNVDQWESSVRSKMQTICSESDAKIVLEGIKEHYENDKKKSLGMSCYFLCVKRKCLKSTSKTTTQQY